MAKDVKFNIRLSIDGKEQIVTASTNVKGLAKELGIARDRGTELRDTLLRFNQATQAISNLMGGFQQLAGVMQGYADAYNVQEEAELRLANVMKERMGATMAEVDAMKQLASAQQAVGVVGDEVQLMGMQQLATFSSLSSTLETLTPAMNNLLVHQKGLKGTGDDAVGVANLLGKALMGQATALQRAGITMTDAQKKTLKLGNEQQRAAVIAEVIAQNVGNINEELAKTDAGKAQQLSNTIGDLKEQVGALSAEWQPLIVTIAEVGLALNAVIMVGNGLGVVVSVFKGLEIGAKMSSLATAAHAMSIRMLGTVSAATGISVNALSIALRGLMIASGIGVAFAALATAMSFFNDEAPTAADYTKQFSESAAQATARMEGLRATLDSVSPASQTYHRTVKELVEIYKEYGIKVKELDPNLRNESAVVEDLKTKHDALAAAIRAESVERQKAAAIQTISDEYQQGMNAIWQRMQNAIGGENAATITAAVKLEISDQEIQRLGEMSDRIKQLRKEGKDLEADDVFKQWRASFDSMQERVAKVLTRFGQTAKTTHSVREALSLMSMEAAKTGKTYRTAMSAVEDGARAVDGYSDSADRAAYANRLSSMSVDELRGELGRLVNSYGNTELGVKIVYEEVNVPAWMQGMDLKETRRLAESFAKMLHDNPNAKEYNVNGKIYSREQVAERSMQYLKASEEKTPKVSNYEVSQPKTGGGGGHHSTRTGSGGSGGGSASDTGPKLVQNAKTYAELSGNVEYYSQALEKANINDAEAYEALLKKKVAAEQALEAYERMKESLEGEALFNENAVTVDDINRNISILQNRLNRLAPNSDEYRAVTAEIEEWQKRLGSLSAGSIAEMEAQIQAIGERLKNMPLNSTATVDLMVEQARLQKELDTETGVLKLRVALETGDAMKDFQKFAAEWKKSSKEQTLANVNKELEQQRAKLNAVAGIAQNVGSAFSSMGQAFDAPVLNVVGLVANAVATMLQAYATATAQAATMGPWAWAGFAAAGFAQVAGIIAQMKSIGKFANGALAYGPTLGLFGEYAGASNNPEVVAPLDKLRSYMPQNDGIGGKVTFKIAGRTLVGILEKENVYRGRM